MSLSVSLVILGFTLGLRHGIDYDHIAAISDLIGGGKRGTAQGFWTGFLLATRYALGHALMVVILGLAALWVGAALPAWVDSVMERVVGITMLALAGWLMHTLWHHLYRGKAIRLKSRQMLMLEGINHALNHLLHREHRQHALSAQDMNRSAVGLGILHGIGAETGSQALLLASIAGAGTPQVASIELGVFVLGLLISNTLIALIAMLGFNTVGSNRILTVGTTAMAMIFSLLMGVVFLTGHGSDLPQLL